MCRGGAVGRGGGGARDGLKMCTEWLEWCLYLHLGFVEAGVRRCHAGTALGGGRGGSTHCGREAASRDYEAAPKTIIESCLFGALVAKFL